MRCGCVGFHGPEVGVLLLPGVVGVVAGRQVRAARWVACCQAVVNAVAQGPMPGS
jgi:hypothetical protein